jgi:mycothiol synthase
MYTMELTPTTLTVRAVRPDDLQAVTDLLAASDLAEFGEIDYTADDVREEWDELDLDRDTWVIVTPDDRIVGYATVSHRGHVRINGDGYVHPDFYGLGIGSRLQTLIETRAREIMLAAPPGTRVVLRNGSNAYNQDSRRLLEAHGYQCVRYFWRMQIQFDGPPPAPVWPDGITVRPFVLGQDDRLMWLALTESFRDHWGSLPEDFETWARHNLDKPNLDTSSWFLAFDGDEVAGGIKCSTFQDLGWIQTLAVRRPWRRRGLGNALLLQAFDVLYRQGKPGAGLGVDAESPTGATRIYERAGMRATRTFAVFEKELRPGVSLESDL